MIAVESKGFMTRAILAMADGITPEQFAERESRRLVCSFCRDWWPRVGDHHELMGVIVPCKAEGPPCSP